MTTIPRPKCNLNFLCRHHLTSQITSAKSMLTKERKSLSTKKVAGGDSPKDYTNLNLYNRLQLYTAIFIPGF